MKLINLLNNIEYSCINGSTDIEINSITIDSRKVKDNSLFVCIAGFNVDGHKFINSAKENGASAIICERDLEKIPDDITIIRVNNSRKALSKISSVFYGNPSSKFNLIGITGTNGKTSSTYFMESILRQYNRKVGVIGTVEIRYNGEKINIDLETSTTPDTVELNQLFSYMSENGADDVVMEVSSHALELDKVTDCEFDIGIFTNLTQDHLDLHKTMENYCQAKAKLFKLCRYGIINADDKYAKTIINSTSCNYMTYSIENESDLKAVNIKYYMNKVEFDIIIDNNMVKFELNVPGKFSVYNALGVIGVALKMGIPADIIKQGIRNIKGVPGRIQNVENDKGFNVIVDYAHSPDGIENIINAVREFTEKRVICIFGCGGDRDKKKRPIMGKISAENADYTILTSDNPRSENPESIIDDIEKGIIDITNNYEKITDRKEAIYRAVNMAEKGDSVIIAGKGHEDYEIFADRTIHFDDLEVAKEALEDLK